MQSVTHVFPGFLTPAVTQLSFQSHQLPFSHASAEVRGENTPERKLASTRYQTHNHQVMSHICSSLTQPGGATKSFKLKAFIDHSFSLKRGLNAIANILQSTHVVMGRNFLVCLCVKEPLQNKVWSFHDPEIKSFLKH